MADKSKKFRCMWDGLEGGAKCYATFNNKADAEKLSKNNAAVLESFRFWIEGERG